MSKKVRDFLVTVYWLAAMTVMVLPPAAPRRELENWGDRFRTELELTNAKHCADMARLYADEAHLYARRARNAALLATLAALVAVLSLWWRS
jgi:hypothetical protein